MRGPCNRIFRVKVKGRVLAYDFNLVEAALNRKNERASIGTRERASIGNTIHGVLKVDELPVELVCTNQHARRAGFGVAKERE